MSKWIPGYQVIEELGIQPFELAELLQKGLQAYTETGKRLVAHDSYPAIELENIQEFLQNKGWPDERIARQGPAIFNFYRKKGMRFVPDNEIDDTNIARTDSFSLPKDERKRNKKIAFYLSMLFKQEDVDLFKTSAAEEQQQPSEDAATAEEAQTFRRGGADKEMVRRIRAHAEEILRQRKCSDKVIYQTLDERTKHTATLYELGLALARSRGCSEKYDAVIARAKRAQQI